MLSATADLLVCFGESEARTQEEQMALQIADAKVAELSATIDEMAELRM